MKVKHALEEFQMCAFQRHTGLPESIFACSNVARAKLRLEYSCTFALNRMVFHNILEIIIQAFTGKLFSLLSYHICTLTGKQRDIGCLHFHCISASVNWS